MVLDRPTLVTTTPHHPVLDRQTLVTTTPLPQVLVIPPGELATTMAVLVLQPAASTVVSATPPHQAHPESVAQV